MAVARAVADDAATVQPWVAIELDAVGLVAAAGSGDRRRPG